MRRRYCGSGSDGGGSPNPRTRSGDSGEHTQGCDFMTEREKKDSEDLASSLTDSPARIPRGARHARARGRRTSWRGGGPGCGDITLAHLRPMLPTEHVLNELRMRTWGLMRRRRYDWL
jgi:hypothetical protein